MSDKPQMTWKQLARVLAEHAKEKSEWAGLPLPLPDLDLVLEEKFPYQLGGIFNKPREKHPDDCVLVNRWWSERLRAFATIGRRLDNGKLVAWYEPYNQGDMLLNTVGASEAWNAEAEWKAMGKLQSLVQEHTFDHYLLTGMFLESSKRSGLIYLFRRLRPTLVFSASRGDGAVRTLCGLCMHSVGYYGTSWAGVLCPTDDVVSHLVFMRGDEHKFWRQCNQHPPHMPQSGI